MVSLPFTSGQSLMRGAAMTLSLALLCACSQRLAPSSASPVPLEQIHDDPVRDAQSSLLREAHRAFTQARYPAAVLFFRRVVDSPGSEGLQLAEARWWLGRSYEETGEYRAAMAEYRVLATGDSEGDAQVLRFQQQALSRLDQLRQIPGRPDVMAARQIAVELPQSQLPPVSGWVAWFQAVLKAGITTVVLDSAAFDWEHEEGRETVQAFIGAAHLAGLSVWGALDLHQGRGVLLKPEWVNRSWAKKGEVVNGHEPTGTPAMRPDPLHPDYQAVIEDRVIRLLRAGCNGIFIRARDSLGYAQEFSDGSFQRFASAFGLTTTPQQLLGDAVEEESTYWRWVGWRARGYATAAAHIGKLIRDADPAGRLLIEIHGNTVVEPLFGLEQYGEDINDLFRRSRGELVIRTEDNKGSLLLEQVTQQVGSSDRLWLVRPVKVPDVVPLVEWTEGLGTVSSEEGEGNLLLMPRAAGNLP